MAQDALIAAAVAPLVAAAFGELDPTNLAGTLPRVKALLAAIVHTYGKASASLAVTYYQAERKHAGLKPLTLTPAPPVTPDVVGASVDWATKGLWGPINTEPLPHQGSVLAPFTERLDAAQSDTAGIVENLAQQPGRDTILLAVQHDKDAKGWARVPEPGACFFCAMLATRGAVYKKTTVDFQAHDHCRCHAEPVFNAYEPSAQIREWQALYRANPGMLAFRRAFEGRTAPVKKPTRPKRQPALV